MPDLIFSMTDAVQVRLITAFCQKYQYKENIWIPDNPIFPSGPGHWEANPETKKQFTHRMAVGYFKGVVEAADLPPALVKTKEDVKKEVDKIVID